MANKTDSKRLIDLRAALKRAKQNDLTKLEDLAALWGVTKPRFVNKMKEFHYFPEFVEKDGNAYLYPARSCIQAMIDYLTKHQEATASRAKRLAALVGDDRFTNQMNEGLPVADLARMNQLDAEVEQRQRDQGLWVHILDVQRVVGMAFSEISEFISNLSNAIDPHGHLPPGHRSLIDTNAHEQLLHLHANLKEMLSPDAVDVGTGKPASKPRKARSRSKRG